METIKIYSPIEDTEIRKSKENLQNSPMWKKAYSEEDLPRIRTKYPAIYEYRIKFEGSKPVMISKVSKV